jgi:uncharacterized DUF497 family protein
VRFQWDPDKYAENLRKHHVRFEAAVTVFEDPNEFTEEDLDAIAERRWRTIGKTDFDTHLFVIHTERGMIEGEVVVRIISARPATAREKKRYERQASFR